MKKWLLPALLGSLLLTGCPSTPTSATSPTASATAASAPGVDVVEKLAGFNWDLTGFKQTDNRPLIRGRTLVLDVTARAISPAQQRLKDTLQARTSAEGAGVVCLVLVKSRPQVEARPTQQSSPPRLSGGPYGNRLPDYQPRPYLSNPRLNRGHNVSPPAPVAGPAMIWEVAVLDLKSKTLSRWHSGISPGSPDQEAHYGQLASYIGSMAWNADVNFVPKEKQWSLPEVKAILAERYDNYSKGWEKRDPDYLLDLYSRSYIKKGKPSYDKRKGEIKEDFDAILKLENEVGLLFLDQTTQMTQVTLTGPGRAKVRYRVVQSMIDKEPGQEIRWEDESVGVDCWACEDEVWRIVEEPESKTVRSQQIVNGKVVENFPLD